MVDKQQFTLKEKFSEINFDANSCIVEPDSGSSILEEDSQHFEISPLEFLEYAKQDFQLANDHGFINALTNVKRSIECQSDIIHYSLGIPYEKLNFPLKIDNLQKMGLTPSLIFKKINNIRVDLEHFYKKPESGKVEDSIEIAQLFIDITTLSLGTFMQYYSIIQIDKIDKKIVDKSGDDVEESESPMYYGNFKNGVKFGYRNDQKDFMLSFIKNGIDAGTVVVNSKNMKDYLKIINLSVQIGKDLRVVEERTQKRLAKEFLLKIFE